MKGVVRYIPNFLTCLSLSFGFYAAIAGLSGHYFVAMTAILIAAVFDFSDGLAARLLKAYSAMGKELDSLADVVSFGVAPGMMLYSFMDTLLVRLSWNDLFGCKIFLLVAFIIPVFSGLRLAKFNIDERQKTSFLGLPVPAHAILWSSLITVLACDVYTSVCIFPQLAGWMAAIPPIMMLIGLSVTVTVTSLLLVSEIPMFSLKITSLSWKVNRLPVLLVVSAVLFLLLFGIAGIAAVILFYILLGRISKTEPA